MRKHDPKICIYCGGFACEREHVPPRCLMERPFPNNLQTLPVCDKCNRSFSLDEEYFITFLSLIGAAKSLNAKVEECGKVDRALSYSSALDDKIINNLSVSECGKVMLTPELHRIRRVIKKIALGLYVLRYNQIPSIDSIEGGDIFPSENEHSHPTNYSMPTHIRRLLTETHTIVQPNIFTYAFVKPSNFKNNIYCVMELHSTAWGFAYLPIS